MAKRVIISEEVLAAARSELARLGGKARAKRLSRAERVRIAKLGAAAMKAKAKARREAESR